jgi:sialate O-acetylesterase
VGYYFGQKLAADLDVPVGLIHSSWGGTRIEPWTTPEGFNSVPALKNIADDIDARDPHSAAHKQLVAKTLAEYKKWLKTTEENYSGNKTEIITRRQPNGDLVLEERTVKGNEPVTKPITAPPAFPAQLNPYTRNQDPTVLYNAMVNPFAGLAIRGAIWYQGESNNGEGALYAEKMKALINGWRKTFNPELGFYWVQIAPFDYGGQRKGQLPELQVAQSSVEKFYSYEHVGQAVINDLVTTVKDIHPPKKLAVGNRLALLALNRTYGKKDVVCASPEWDKMEINGATVVLNFKNAKELKTRDGKAPTWFEIAGADGIYHPAEAAVAGTTIQLTSPEVPKPYAARFAWDQIAEPNVENEAGLPLSPFKAGEVPVRAAK